jgi:hypothetical protein
MCINPFYNDPVFPMYKIECPINDSYFCNQPYFLPGYTLGEDKSKDIKAFPYFILCLFAYGFVLNHIWYNKRRIKKNEL